jgi:hypothetical protein
VVEHLLAYTRTPHIKKEKSTSSYSWLFISSLLFWIPYLLYIPKHNLSFTCSPNFKTKYRNDKIFIRFKNILRAKHAYLASYYYIILFYWLIIKYVILQRTNVQSKSSTCQNLSIPFHSEMIDPQDYSIHILTSNDPSLIVLSLTFVYLISDISP